MGRTRQFDTAEVVASASAVFGRRGYAACSVDDLVTELGLHRGSLYRTFASKRGLFVRALEHAVSAEVSGIAAALRSSTPAHQAQIAATAESLDIIVVGAWEAPDDVDVSRVVTEAVTALGAAIAGADAGDGAHRAAGLAVLACRLGGRSSGRRDPRDLAPIMEAFGDRSR